MFKGGRRVISVFFVCACISLLAGVLLASLVSLVFPLYWWLAIAFGFIFIGIICVSFSVYIKLIFWCLFFIFVGVLRYQMAFPIETSQSLSLYHGKKVSLVGYVSREPDIRQDKVLYSIEGMTIDQATISGKISVSLPLYPRFSYGDVVAVECKLKKPEPIEGFRYDMFLARYGVFTVCQFPKITQQDGKKGTFFFHGLFFVKNAVAQHIQHLWHEPYASFMAGLLYGYRGGLGTLNELFSITGVTHIVAISGYNITIISSLFLAICFRIGINRTRAFWIVVGGVIVFVLFAGASASVVRAGIMGIILLVAMYCGRLSRVGRVLLLTAVIMTLHNPLVLVWDAGFQLSFLSTIGLVYLSPYVTKYASWIPVIGGIRESFVSTISATLMTLPFILYQFGRLSLVSVAVNMLILWILPYIMFFGFVSVVIRSIYEPLGAVISVIALGGMVYIVSVVKWFASISFAAIDVVFPLWGMMVCYMIIIYVLYRGQSGIK